MAKKIVVVDDSRSVRQQVKTSLADAGYEVIEAEDGAEGVAKIRGNTDVAMVICDVNMPRMNGLELVAAIKKEGAYSTLPIVMLTTEGQPELIERAKKAGAKGWIVKPFKPELLVATVKKLAGPVV